MMRVGCAFFERKSTGTLEASQILESGFLLMHDLWIVP